MDDIAIRVTGVSKFFDLYEHPADRLLEALSPTRKIRHTSFAALNNVSFEVRRGEVVGIVGRNGSGKSTLLQIIAGVLQPTHGSVVVNGKIAALLELGAGFNPEFTGIENVFFNGSLMGFSRAEMTTRVAEIANFAEIGDFIHYPLKTYSSGMFVRLAFACAIHVDPEILIIDEALAVGDVKFQKKCFDHLNRFIEAGRTVLIVTHGRIKDIAQTGIVLERGELRFAGSSADADLWYMRSLYPDTAQPDPQAPPIGTLPPSPSDKPRLPVPVAETARVDQYCLEVDTSASATWGVGGAWIDALRIYGLSRPNLFAGGEELVIEATCRWDQEKIAETIAAEALAPQLIFGVTFETARGVILTGIVSTLMEQEYNQPLVVDPLVDSACAIRFRFRVPQLAAGDYFLGPAIALGTQEKHMRLRTLENLVHLTCVPKQRYTFGLMNWQAIVERIPLNGNQPHAGQ